MSERETSILERYWQRVGGTLILEFPLVRKTPASSPRRVDGLILPDAERRVTRWGEFKGEERKTMEAELSSRPEVSRVSLTGLRDYE